MYKRGSKRGAITLFIIAGIILLVFISFAVYLSNVLETKPTVKKSQQLPEELKPIGLFVDSCIEQSARSAIKMNSMQGGFNDVRFGKDFSTGADGLKDTLMAVPLTFTSQKLGIEELPLFVPYYFYNGQDMIPTEEEIKTQFKKRMMMNIFSCLDFSQLNNFGDYGYQIEAFPEQADLNVDMVDDGFVIKLIYPLKINIGGAVKEWSVFEHDVETVYPMLYKASKEFSQDQLENGNYICLTCMQDIADKYNLIIESQESENYGEVSYYEDETSFNITDVAPKHSVQLVYFFMHEDVNNQNISFAFAHAFDVTGEYTDAEHNENIVKIVSIPDIETEVGYELSYKVEALGKGLRYYDNTPLLDIDEKSGTIKFMPDTTDIGSYIIKIGVIDADENVGTDTFQLTVKEAASTPKIDYIDLQTAYVGLMFSYQVVAENGAGKDGDLVYLDDTTLFDVNKDTGVIAFIPQQKDVGEYKIKISVIDEQGVSSEKEMELNIVQKYDVE